MYIVIIPDWHDGGFDSESFETIQKVAEYIETYLGHVKASDFEVFKTAALAPTEEALLAEAIQTLKDKEAERNHRALKVEELKRTISQKQATIRAKRKTLEEVGHELAQEYRTSRWNQIQGLEQEVISLNQELEQLNNA